MSHNTLGNYYQVIFSLAQHHHYSIADIENLYPFERDIFVDMLTDYLKKLEEERAGLA
jgi:hypothetical protein